MGTSIPVKWTSLQRSELQRGLEDTKPLSQKGGKLAQMKNAIEILNNNVREGKLAQMKNAIENLNNNVREGWHGPMKKLMLTVYENVNNKVHCVRDDDRVETNVKATHKKTIKPQHEGDNGKNDRFLLRSVCC